MFSSITKLFQSSSIKQTVLRNLSFEGSSCNFYIDFDDNDQAKSMMFEILNMYHEKAVHTIMRVEKTSLSVSIEHDIDNDDDVIDLVDRIDKKALEYVNGKIH